MTPGAGITSTKRIVVAMSGGVDSSVVAGLMKAAGHEVIGITLQLYDHGAASGRAGSCCAGQDIHDARQVAAKLDIPHYVLDYERRFEAEVMQTFASSYVAGETPIPCVACNQSIKFRDLLAMAEDLGADYMATGHYVGLNHGADGPELFQGADGERDQSYFLFSTPPDALAKLMFPLGTMTKSEVRRYAEALALPVAAKADSQDICFVPSGRYTDVVEKLRPDARAPGDIVHVDGRVLGRHDGIIHFTVGQRRGLKLAVGEPLYVIGLDAGRRQVTVGERKYLETRKLVLRDVNWLGNKAMVAKATADGLAVYVRVRSTSQPVPATLAYDTEKGSAEVLLEVPEFGVARGQACVFYDGDQGGARVLGGGWIAETASAAALAA